MKKTTPADDPFTGRHVILDEAESVFFDLLDAFPLPPDEGPTLVVVYPRLMDEATRRELFGHADGLFGHTDELPKGPA